MRLYVGIDDTDTADSDRGTGKLARWLADRLPEGVTLYGIVRQQLPILDGIPYTSRNSSACLILEIVDPDLIPIVTDCAAEHIAAHFIDGSDPGLCVIPETSDGIDRLKAFGRLASTCIVTQGAAMAAAADGHLSGHGGSHDGIIGAAAGVGLTLSGWSGRFIEFKGLRDFADIVSVADLERRRIRVLAVDRDALVPAATDRVDTRGWLRPRLWGGTAVLPVENAGDGAWRSIHAKRRK